MATFHIPSDLIDMVRERRVIPFLGAGFSSSHGLPGWDGLLDRIARDNHCPVPMAEIRAACNNNPLQIAEYLLLSAGGTGPLHLSMSRALQRTKDALSSTAHVELANLGAPQIYTTNFDELIEHTFEALGEPAHVVALPRDIAASYDPGVTQVVKFHGDLRYERTLVLTESQYYKRLEFDAPMDLKFRSDLLGRSVLFMGYSFQDVNIRVIWFRLMEMMQDVPVADRSPSYIVRFEPNEILDALYKEVGLETITIDPDGRTTGDPDQQVELFGRFMHELAEAVATDGMRPGRLRRLIASPGLFADVRALLAATKGEPTTARIRWVRELTALVPRLAQRNFLDSHKVELTRVLRELYAQGNERLGVLTIEAELSLAAVYLRRFGVSDVVAAIIAQRLQRERSRALLLAMTDFPWTDAWSANLAVNDASRALHTAERNYRAHGAEFAHEDDLPYSIDIVVRIAKAQIVRSSRSELRARASALLESMAADYPGVADYEPTQDGPPQVEDLKAGIARVDRERAEASGAVPIPYAADDDIPF